MQFAVQTGGQRETDAPLYVGAHQIRVYHFAAVNRTYRTEHPQSPFLNGDFNHQTDVGGESVIAADPNIARHTAINARRRFVLPTCRRRGSVQYTQRFRVVLQQMPPILVLIPVGLMAEFADEAFQKKQAGDAADAAQIAQGDRLFDNAGLYLQVRDAIWRAVNALHHTFIPSTGLVYRFAPHLPEERLPGIARPQCLRVAVFIQQRPIMADAGRTIVFMPHVDLARIDHFDRFSYRP